MGRSGAIRPAIANTSAAVARNAWPIRDLLMSSTFDTVANIISETCDIPRDTIKPESHAINDLGIDSLDFLDIAFAIDKAFGIKMPLEQWTQDVKDGKATTVKYFRFNNILMSYTFSTINKIISNTCNIPRDTIKPESHAINDLGIDSLDFLDIAFAIDKAFGIKMPLEQWTQDVNDGKATTEQYFQLNNLCTRIDELVAAKGA